MYEGNRDELQLAQTPVSEAVNRKHNQQQMQFCFATFPTEEKFSNAINTFQVLPLFDRRQLSYYLPNEVEDTCRTFQTVNNGQGITVKITAASVKRKCRKTGKLINVLMWPGNREETVLDAILFIASQKGISKLDGVNFEQYGCYFSLYEINAITKINIVDIKNCIEVLHKSNLEITNSSDNKLSWSSTFLPIKYLSTRRGTKNDKCYIAFHPAIMSAIKDLEYRPYLFASTEQHTKGLTKYFHKRLIIKYTYAKPTEMYNIGLRKLLNDFGSIPQEEEVDVQKLRNLAKSARITLNELRDANVILGNFTIETKYNKGVLYDMLITVFATKAFTNEQSHSNSLIKDRNEVYEEGMASLLDN